MHFSWLGGTSVKIQIKPKNNDVVIVVNPYKPVKGSFPKSLSPDIAIFTNGEKDSITLSGNPFILSTPGEIEVKDVLISSAQGNGLDETLLRIDTEGISVAHLGITNKPLTEKQLEIVGGVDILLLPVGGGKMFNAEQALNALNEIEPRIVIPIGQKSDNDTDAKDVSEFIKEFGLQPKATESKIIIKKKDLPQEETELYVLTKD